MADGDDEAWAELYLLHAEAMLAYLVAVGADQEAEDLLHETMVVAWCKAGGFRGEGQVKAWLVRIARNKFLDAGRGRSPLLDDFSLNDVIDPCDGPEDQALASAGKEELDREIADLPPPLREVAVLALVLELRMAEIADVLEGAEGTKVAEGTVKSRLNRARSELKRRIQERRKGGEGD